MIRDFDEFVEHFQKRFIQDAMNSATAAYWRRRAATFRDARPRPDDFTGSATEEDLRARWDRLTARAHACEAHATVLEGGLS